MVLHLMSASSLLLNSHWSSCSATVGAPAFWGGVGAGGWGMVYFALAAMDAHTSPPFLNVAPTCSDSFFKVVAYLLVWWLSEQSKMCPLSASHAPWNFTWLVWVFGWLPLPWLQFPLHLACWPWPPLPWPPLWPRFELFDDILTVQLGKLKEIDDLFCLQML